MRDGPLSVETLVIWDYEPAPDFVEASRTADLLRHALKSEGESGEWTITVRFVDDHEIAELHDRFLGDPDPTDIMTFPYDPDDGERGGDIVVSIDTAKQSASEQGWSVAEELDFLILHGVLHILGWDDATEQGRAAMLARQGHLLRSWHRAD